MPPTGRSLTLRERGEHGDAELDIFDTDDGNKTRIRVRERSGKASIFLTDDQVDMLASEIAIRRGHTVVKVWPVTMEWAEGEDRAEFAECATCKAKPGSPTLCEACLHNRATIGRLVDLNATHRAVEVKRVKLIDSISSKSQAMRAESQAMRAALVYARDRRGNAFDYDTWRPMVDSALEHGVVPPHAVEDAQSEAQLFRTSNEVLRKANEELRAQLDNVRDDFRAYREHRRAVRTLPADSAEIPADRIYKDPQRPDVHIVAAIEELRSDMNEIGAEIIKAIGRASGLY